jgi:hypothetical protein
MAMLEERFPTLPSACCRSALKEALVCESRALGNRRQIPRLISSPITISCAHEIACHYAAFAYSMLRACSCRSFEPVRARRTGLTDFVDATGSERAGNDLGRFLVGSERAENDVGRFSVGSERAENDVERFSIGSERAENDLGWFWVGSEQAFSWLPRRSPFCRHAAQCIGTSDWAAYFSAMELSWIRGRSI